MRAAAASALVSAFALAACGGGSGPAGPADEGYLTLDSSLILDRYAFSSAACAEVLPPGFANSDTLPADAAARVVVRSTACYAVSIAVEDSLGGTVRSMTRHFDIPGRRDGDKDRAALGYLPWDGRDQAGERVAPGSYLWRLEFRFGAGRVLRFRADIRVE